MRRKLLLLLAFLAVALNASAYSFVAQNADGVNIYYNLLSDKECQVTAENSFSETASYKGNVVIPSSVTFMDQTYNVTSIGEYAFLFV